MVLACLPCDFSDPKVTVPPVMKKKQMMAGHRPVAASVSGKSYTGAAGNMIRKFARLTGLTAPVLVPGMSM